MSKTFGLAFSEARKQGLDKFLWNGNWYSTKTKEESTSKGAVVTNLGRNASEKTIKGSTTVSNGKALHSVKQGNRYTITKMNKDQFAIFDNEDGVYVSTAGAFNSLKDAQNYLNSDTFKNSIDVQITAPITKLNRKTSGFTPVDGRTDLVDKLGTTRVFLNYETGEYFVTDNYGNIVGQSYDPAAANPGFMGWNVYTGNKDDLTRSELGRKKQEFTRNEVNQLARLKEDRQRAGEEGLIKDIQRGRENFAKGAYNVIMAGLNTPTHAITGLLRTIHPDYSMQDYLKGFYAIESPQTTGLGTVASDYMEEGLAKNIVLLGGDLLTPTFMKLPRKVKGQGFYSHFPTHVADAHQTSVNAGRHLDLGHATLHNTKGRSAGNFGTNLFRNVSLNEPISLQNVSRKLKNQITLVGLGTKNTSGKYSILNPKTHQVTTTGTGASAVSPKKLKYVYDAPEKMRNAIRTTYRPGVKNNYIEGLTSWTKPKAVFSYRNFAEYSKAKNSNSNTNSPTAVFKYNNAPSNLTVLGRIQTGDFVPGTTSPTWDGTIHGGQSNMYNTNGLYFPGFGGVTVSPTLTNITDIYTNDATPSKS